MSGTGPGNSGGLPDSGQRYERGERIATGGMGEVWRARDTVLGREVAVKVLKQEYADDPTFRARFADEARHAAGLHHPGIAAIFDYGALEGETPYLVMELVDGRPLSELLADGRAIDPEQARLLSLQVAEGLAAAHQAGVVHRDVKPGNLLVTPDGRIKITDFGIARAAGSVAYTQTGQIVGTPNYISPEQARGEPATAASDVYALGVVLFECLAGERPFVADSPIATALAHIRDDVPPLPDHIPPALAAVVGRALAKDPAERYSDGGEFAAALRDADGAGGAVPPPAATTRVMDSAVPAAAPLATATDTTPPQRETTDRNRWPLYAVAALALLLLAALLIAKPWNDPGSTSDDTPPADDTVQVRADDYIGDPVDDVEAALADKGLETETNDVDNAGDHEAGTVAGLSPTGQVERGSTITLDVWGEPPSDEGDQGNEDKPKPKKEKSPKPETPKPEKPEEPEESEESGDTVVPDNSGTGGTGGAEGSAPAPSGGETSTPAADGRVTTPGTDAKGD